MGKCFDLLNSTALFRRGDDRQTCGPSISGVQFCCVSGDTCLEDSICHYNHPLAGGSGYYVGGCTDPSFPEPCSKSCTNWQTGDIVFIDASTSLWACCYQYLGAELDCANPGNETFYAPSPESLTRQAESSSTTFYSATSSINSSITPSSTTPASKSTPTPTPTSTSTSTSTSSTSSPTLPTSIPPSSAITTHAPSSALSTVGKPGIGIAASIAGLGIMVIVGFYLLRKRRPRHHHEAPAVNVIDEMTSSSPPTADQINVAVEKSSEQQWELDGNGRSEVDGRGRLELEASR